MADSEAKFTVDLALKDADEIPKARKDLEDLRATLDRNSASLSKMTAAYRNLKVGGRVNSEQAKELKIRIDATKKSIGEAQSRLLNMKGGLAGTTKGAKESSKAFEGLAYGAKATGGRLASATSTASGFVSKMGVAGVATAGLAAVAVGAVAAVVALDVAIAKATIRLATYGVKAADAYRSERLALEGMTQAWRGWWFQRPVGKAEDVQAAIDDVSSSVNLGRDKVNQYAQSLYRAGLRGAALKQGLEGVAYAAAGGGEEYGAQAQAMVSSAALFGKSVKGMADVFKSRFGSIVERQMLSLPNQLAKAREGFTALFRGLKIDPVLRGLDKILGVFKTSSVEFKAWKQIFESLFNPLFSGAEEAGGVIREFVDSVTIMALRATLAWEKFKGSATLRDESLKKFKVSFAGIVEGVSGFTIGFLQATQAVIVFGQVTSNVLSSVYNLIKLVAAPLKLLFGSSLADAKQAQSEAIKGLGDAGEGLANASGSQMIAGIIRGIKDAQPGLVQAAEDAAKASNDAFKNAQGIHSPSRVWAKFGRFMGEGAALGVKASTPKFEDASERLAAAPAAQPTPRQGKDHAPRSVTVNVPVTVNVQGGSGPAGIDLAELRTQLAAVFEGIVLQAAARLGGA